MAKIADEFSQIALDANRTYRGDRLGPDHHLARNAAADWLEEAGAVSLSARYSAQAALDALRRLPCGLAWSRKNQSVQITVRARPTMGQKNTARYTVYVTN